MKFALRLAALSAVVFAAVSGNPMSHANVSAAIHRSSVPGPVPTCNPFTQTCKNLR